MWRIGCREQQAVFGMIFARVRRASAKSAFCAFLVVGMQDAGPMGVVALARGLIAVELVHAQVPEQRVVLDVRVPRRRPARSPAPGPACGRVFPAPVRGPSASRCCAGVRRSAALSTVGIMISDAASRIHRRSRQMFSGFWLQPPRRVAFISQLPAGSVTSANRFASARPGRPKNCKPSSPSPSRPVMAMSMSRSGSRGRCAR
jgi:hypothetical protein